MTRILVTGGAGVLGSAIVARLVEHAADQGIDIEVTALVQAGTEVTLPDGVRLRVGDVRKRSDVDPAVAAADVVIHTATQRRHPMSVDVSGTQQVAYACTEKQTNLVYPSVVGCEFSSLPYYRAKARAEKTITSVPGLGWTIARSTQFHPTLDAFLALPIVPLPAKARFQPVDPRDFAGRLVGLALVGPSGRVDDFGGPEVLTVTEMARIRRSIAGEAGRVWPLPKISALGEAADGLYVLADGDTGQTRYGQWLEAENRPAS